MRSRRNHKVSGQFAQEQAAGILDGVLKPDRGVRGTANAVMNAVLTAAAQMVSVFASCLQLGQITDQTVRDQLRKRLPKSARGLEDKMNEALRQPLPRGTRRRRRVVSIDFHEIPYHGDTDNQNDLLHKKPRAGTTKFFAYATAFISEQGHRYTLAYTWVRRNESTVKILGRLLAQIERSGVKIRRLLLDRGFFSVAVMSFLKGQNVPFLMPVVFRGRKPKKGKRHTGWRAFLQKNAGWYTHTGAGPSLQLQGVCPTKIHREKKHCVVSSWRDKRWHPGAFPTISKKSCSNSHRRGGKWSLGEHVRANLSRPTRTSHRWRMSLFKLAKRSPRVCCKPCWSSTPSNFLPRSLAPLAKRRARSNASHGCCICVAAASSNTMNRSVNARPVGEPFSPSRLELGLDNHSYTPTVLANIVFAGGDAKSFGKGEAYLRRLAELDITGRHVGRLTEKIGAELARQRDEEVALYRRRELPAAVEVTPAAVVVEVDGGRVQTRTPAQGFGVHDPHWREDKAACLCTLHSTECAD